MECKRAEHRAPGPGGPGGPPGGPGGWGDGNMNQGGPPMGGPGFNQQQQGWNQGGYGQQPGYNQYGNYGKCRVIDK